MAKSKSKTKRLEAGATFRRQVDLEIRAEDIDTKKRTLPVSFSSETREITFFGTPVILLHEKGAANFDRVNSVLLNHNPDVVLGRAEGVELDLKARKGRGTIVFDADDEAERVWQKVQSGSIRGVSVGFRADGFVDLDEGDEWQSPEGRKFAGPAIVVRSWKAYEFSLTPIPADGSVGVGRTSGRDEPGNPKEAEHMADQNDRADPPEDTERTVPPTKTADPPKMDEKAIRAEATQLERERSEEIRSLCDQWPETRDMAAELLKGATVEQARSAVLKKLAETRQPVGTARATVLVDERDKWREAAQDHLLLRTEVGQKSKEITDQRRAAARDVPCYTLFDLARECVRRMGVNPAGMSREDLVMIALGTRAISNTSSDFPLLLANVATKSLQAAWNEAPATYAPLVRKRSVPDFKNVYHVKLGDMGVPELTAEGSPMPEGSLAEGGENYRIYTYSKRFGITRQAIINDDLDAFSRVPALMGAACRRKLNQLFWDLLVSQSGTGPQMAEDAAAYPLFSASHVSGSNYTAAAAAIGIDTLSAAKKLMRLQKGLVPAGETAPTLNIAADYFIVPAALEYLAQQLVSSFTPVVHTASVPAWIKTLQVIVEPLLDAATNGLTAWYLAASPGQIDGCEMAFLNGKEEPTMLRVEGTNILGIEYGVYMDAGVKFVEHRGWYRAKGA